MQDQEIRERFEPEITSLMDALSAAKVPAMVIVEREGGQYLYYYNMADVNSFVEDASVKVQSADHSKSFSLYRRM